MVEVKCADCRRYFEAGMNTKGCPYCGSPNYFKMHSRDERKRAEDALKKAGYKKK